MEKLETWRDFECPKYTYSGAFGKGSCGVARTYAGDDAGTVVEGGILGNI